MFLEKICTPALIYIIFSLIQIILDVVDTNYSEAFIKLWVALVFTILLNFLCNKGLGLVSWLLVFIPFILMSTVVSILLVVFGLSPKTGRFNVPEQNIEEPEVLDVRELERMNREKEIEQENNEIDMKINEQENKVLEDGSKIIEAPQIIDPLERYVKSCNILKNKEVAPSVLNACGSILKTYERQQLESMEVPLESMEVPIVNTEVNNN
jgi:hypothetical protein